MNWTPETRIDKAILVSRSPGSKWEFMQSEPTVFVVDDDPKMLTALTLLLQSVRLRVKSFQSAQDFLEAVGPDCSGCLVLDIRMPTMSGLQLQEKLNERGISIPIVILSGFGDVSIAVQALKKGAFDFLGKPFQNQQFLDTIQAALRKNEEMRAKKAWRDELEARVALLSPREREILDLIFAGKHNKVIAAQLKVSTRTVEYHRNNIMQKMQSQNLVELICMMKDLNSPN